MFCASSLPFPKTNDEKDIQIGNLLHLSPPKDLSNVNDLASQVLKAIKDTPHKSLWPESFTENELKEASLLNITGIEKCLAKWISPLGNKTNALKRKENEENQNLSKRMRLLDNDTQSEGCTSFQDDDSEFDQAQRTLFSQNKQVMASAEKCSEIITSIVEAMSNSEMGTESGRLKPPFTKDAISDLNKTIKDMHTQNILIKLPVETLLELQPYLDKQIQYGITLDPYSTASLGTGDEAWESSGGLNNLVKELSICIDAANILLTIMSTPGIDRRLLLEDSMENLVSFYQHVVCKILSPTLDDCHLATAPAKDTADPGADENLKIPGSSKKSRRGSSARKSKSDNSQYSSLRRKIKQVAPLFCECMEHIHDLILEVKLEDRTIMRLSNVSMGIFELETSNPTIMLQSSSIGVLRAIFLRHPQHRDIVIEDIFILMAKLPTNKRTLRTYSLYDSQKSIQMVSALIIFLVQSTTSTAAYTSSEGGRSIMEEGRNTARILIGGFLKKCSKKDEEVDYKLLLSNFTEDLLTVFVLPEWPAAETILDVLSASLASILSDNVKKKSKKSSIESNYGLSALDTLGKICTTIRLHCKSVEEDPLENDPRLAAILQQHSDFFAAKFQDAKWLEEEQMTDKGDEQDSEDEETSVYDMKDGEGANKKNYKLQNITMSYLSERARMEPRLVDAYRHTLARCMESFESFDDKDSPVYEYWNALYADPYRTVSHLTPDPPNSFVARRISVELTVSLRVCRRFDRFLAHIMALLNRGQPSFRARVIKSLMLIVDVDPMLMGNESLKKAVCLCFLDEGISVRKEAIELVGKYILMSPELVDQYYDRIADRICDTGVSVRKRVVCILRDLLLKNRSVKHGSKSLLKMVERLGDPLEEESVKDLIIGTFQEIWFNAKVRSSNETPQTPTKLSSGTVRSLGSSPIPRSSPAPSSADVPQSIPKSVAMEQKKYLEEESLLIAIHTIIDVVYAIKNSEWLVTLLKCLLRGKESDRDKRTLKERKKDVLAVKLRSEKLINGIMECLMKVEEGNLIADLSTNEPELQLLACIKGLHTFSRACPELIVRHIQSLSVYLKGDERMDKSNQCQLLAMVAEMISYSLPLMEHPSQRMISQLELDLKKLAFSAPPQVVSPSIECLAVLATRSSAVHSPELISLFKILQQFYKFMCKFRGKTSLGPETLSSKHDHSLQRAAYSCGLILRHVDMDYHDLGSENSEDDSALHRTRVLNSVYDLYKSFISKVLSSQLKAALIQGLGFLFIRYPSCLLKAQQDNILGLMLTDNCPEVCIKCVSSLTNVLREEEARLEKGAAAVAMNGKKSKQEQVQGDQEGEAALISGVMQAQLKNILKLAVHKEFSLRSETLTLLGLLLTQGLISPLHCVPTLVALETDESSEIRDSAHHHIVTLTEKFPNLLNASVVHGIQLSHAFQRKAFSKCSVMVALDGGKEETCLYGRLYTSCLRKTRSKRESFLNSLVSLFDDKGAVLRIKSIKKRRTKVLDFLCYATKILANLPYDVEEEPLYVIYLINRYVSLRASGLLTQLKTIFRDAGVFPEIIMSDEIDIADLPVHDLDMSELNSAGAQESLPFQQCLVAVAIALLLRLKQFLKRRYLLDDTRCQTYNPSSSVKANDEKPAYVKSDSEPLDLPSVEEMTASTKMLELWNQCVLFSTAVKSDHKAVDFDMTSKSVPKTKSRRKRRKSKTIVPEEVDDDEYVDGF